MITVLPMQEETRKMEILQKYPAMHGKPDVIAMCEKSEELGFAVLSVDGSVLRIFDIVVNGQAPEALDMMGKMVADSLMRSAASYGEHFGADEIVVEAPMLESFLEAKGFQKAGDCMTAPMHTIVHHTNPHK